MWGRQGKSVHEGGVDISQRRALARWYDTVLGREMCAIERQRLERVLPNLFGYYLLQLGWLPCPAWLDSSRVQHRAVIDPGTAGDDVEVMVRSELDCLAVASDSVDVVVLPHTLAFHPNPHQVLREVERVLIPEGHLVILGFNPWSLWGGQRLLLRWCGHAPWCGKFLSPLRVRDWLSLLGFDVVHSESYFYRPAIARARVLDRLRFLERFGQRYWSPLGGGYMLVARKRVSTLTPIRPRWRAGRRLVSTEMARHSLRRKNIV